MILPPIQPYLVKVCTINQLKKSLDYKAGLQSSREKQKDTTPRLLRLYVLLIKLGVRWRVLKTEVRNNKTKSLGRKS